MSPVRLTSRACLAFATARNAPQQSSVCLSISHSGHSFIVALHQTPVTFVAARDTFTLERLRNDPSLRALGLVVTDVLGEGGSSIVYRARDDRHGRDVAVKVIRYAPQLERAAERFSQEIRVAGHFRHPHILPLFDSGTLEDGRRFFVMPVAPGRPLRDVIDEGPMPVDLAVRLAREIAEALAHLHRCGFVHRDVKPENVLVEAGHAVLTDFGLAVPMQPQTPQVPPAERESWWTTTAAHKRFTSVGTIVGTPYYMSPEALFAEGSLDDRIDIYALGVVLYEMLTGDLPFGVTTPEQLVARMMNSNLPSVSARRTDVPAAVDAIIARATKREASARYQTADQMAEALTQLGIGLNASDNREAGRTRIRRRIGIAALAVAMLVAGGGWLAARDTSLDPNRIVVADLANDPGDASLAGVGVLAGDIIAASLTADDRLTVVNATAALPSHLQVNLLSADSLTRETQTLVQASRAGLAVTGAYFRTGKQLQVVVEVTDTRSSRVLGVAGPVYAETERPDSSLHAIADSVVAILHRRN